MHPQTRSSHLLFGDRAHGNLPYHHRSHWVLHHQRPWRKTTLNGVLLSLQTSSPFFRCGIQGTRHGLTRTRSGTTCHTSDQSSLRKMVKLIGSRIPSSSRLIAELSSTLLYGSVRRCYRLCTRRTWLDAACKPRRVYRRSIGTSPGRLDRRS